MRNGWIHVTGLSIAAILAMPALAGQTAYEGFDLTFPAFSTGTGFSGPWAIGGFNVVAAGYTANPSRCPMAPGRTVKDISRQAVGVSHRSPDGVVFPTNDVESPMVRLAWSGVAGTARRSHAIAVAKSPSHQ
jgi:hypothetical protein